MEWMWHHDFMRMIWCATHKDVAGERRKGMSTIWKLTPYGQSRTYFWTQLVYYAMNNSSNEQTLELLHTDFQYVLIMTPSLCTDNDDIISKYYSEELLKVISKRHQEN